MYIQVFIVTLVNPQDGAEIGDLNSVTVTINRNDDVNGVFSFDSVLVSKLVYTNYMYETLILTHLLLHSLPYSHTY